MNGNTLQTHRVEVLGCKVNQYDAQQIERLLSEYGLDPAPESGEADLIVIHTCGVTAAAARKSRQTIRKMQGDNPLARIMVTGCAAEDELTRIDQEPVARIPAGADWLQRMAEELDRLALPSSGNKDRIETDDFAIAGFGNHKRAFLKVQDGCDIGCSFCIIPQLRKGPRDKTIGSALEEASLLVKKGYREIVITGVSVGLYGRDTGGSLAELLRRIAGLPGIGRIRLSSLHPGELTNELLDVWSSFPHIMPHLHLSLQSGSNAVLHAMRRGYTAEEYMDAVQRARAALDNPAFTTDIIVGFPGETDARFEESFAFCRSIGFSQMHIFTYSPRPKTLAAKMGQQINGAVATERSERLHALGREMALSFHAEFLNQRADVLVEQVKDGWAHGYSEHYIPVQFPVTGEVEGTVAEVIIREANEDHMVGHAAHQEGTLLRNRAINL